MNKIDFAPFDDEAHLIGNGRMFVCGVSADIYAIHPEYAAPSFCSVSFNNSIPDSFIKTQRIAGTSVWLHRLLQVAQKSTPHEDIISLATAEDMVFKDRDVFVRRMKTSVPITFKLILPGYIKISHYRKYRIGTESYPVISLVIPKGTPFLFNDTSAEEYRMYMLIKGEHKIDMDGILINLFPGEADIVISTGTEPSRILKETVGALNRLSSKSAKDKLYYFQDAPRFEDTKFPSETADAMESIFSHVSRDLGIISSYLYPMMEPHLQYAATRLFCNIGRTDLAGEILNKRYNEIRGSGILYWSEGKTPSLRHRSSCDASLSPAYFILSVFEYGDKNMIKRYLNDLISLEKFQTGVLVSGMMPFNGHEFYINSQKDDEDGSSIATMLYIKSTETLCDYLEKNRLYDTAKFRSAAQRARNMFADNFIRDGMILLNSKKRKEKARLPRFKYGICRHCSDRLSNPWFEWLERTPSGTYACSDCFSENLSENSEINEETSSVLPLLVSVYLDYDILDKNALYASISQISLQLSNIMDTVTAALLLYAQAKLRHPMAGSTYKHLLKLRTSTGVWPNGFSATQPYGVRCSTLSNVIASYAILEYLNIK